MRGHRAALVWLCVAGVVVVIAFLILLWASTGRGQGSLSPPAIATAAVWIALLGVCATVVAIVAAYVELRTLFPSQELGVEAVNIWGIHQEGGGTWVIFRNETSNALINSFRLELRLENEDGSLLADREPDDWTGALHWVQQQDLETNLFDTHWVRQENEPFFPGSTIEGPHLTLSKDAGLYWRVTWWTDRAGPVEVLLPVPPPRGAPPNEV